MFSATMSFIKYLSVGFLIWIVGMLFCGNTLRFIDNSAPAQLYVADIQSRSEIGELPKFRPVFKLASARSSRQAYEGDTWLRPAPHKIGDIVAGRYDAKTGEMRSDRMLRITKWVGWAARILGIVMALQALAILFGVPEYRLPLRVRLGSGRSSPRSWLRPA